MELNGRVSSAPRSAVRRGRAPKVASFRGDEIVAVRSVNTAAEVPLPAVAVAFFFGDGAERGFSPYPTPKTKSAGSTKSTPLPLLLLVTFTHSTRRERTQQTLTHSTRTHSTQLTLTQQTQTPTHEHPVVLPQVSHFKQVPLRTRVKFAHSGQLSPT